MKISESGVSLVKYKYTKIRDTCMEFYILVSFSKTNWESSWVKSIRKINVFKNSTFLADLANLDFKRSKFESI